jgi:phenylacetate-CoA ligase
MFDRHGIRPEQIQWPEDLQRLPLLTKADVIRNFDELISRGYARVRGHLIGTSGTTGTPLQLYWDHRREAMETALLLRHLSWAGFHRGTPKAVLRGLEVRQHGGARTAYWRLNAADNELLFSSAHLSEATIPSYLERLRSFRPAVIWGYPSSVYVLAAHLERLGTTAGLDLKGVFLSSEPVHPWQRRVIETSFETRVFDWYGLSEGVLSAGECERHEGYHVNVESGVMEVVPSPDRPGLKEIVATGLDNYMMPLMRYTTGDVGDWLDATCSCGRGLPLMAGVDTKAEDMVVTPDGRWISPSVLTFPFKSMKGIARSQVVQMSPAEITVKIVPTDVYSRPQERQLVEGLRARLGPNVDIQIERVADIPRTAAGKYRWVVSNVAPRSAARSGS